MGLNVNTGPDCLIVGAVAGNYIDLGGRANSPVNIVSPFGVLVNGVTIGVSGAITAGATALTVGGVTIKQGAAPGGVTACTVAGTTTATLKLDTASNGGTGTANYTFTDLVLACKQAGIIPT